MDNKNFRIAVIYSDSELFAEFDINKCKKLIADEYKIVKDFDRAFDRVIDKLKNTLSRVE